MIRVLALYQNGQSKFNVRRSFLISRLEKKLAIALKSLLILEAVAKAVFIVNGLLAEKGTLLSLRRLIYKHIYRYLQLLLVASL